MTNPSPESLRAEAIRAAFDALADPLGERPLLDMAAESTDAAFAVLRKHVDPARMRKMADYLDSLDGLADVLVEHAHPAFRALSTGDQMQRDLRRWAALLGDQDD